MVENPETGLKKNNRIRLEGVTDVNRAIKGMYSGLAEVESERANTDAFANVKPPKSATGKALWNVEDGFERRIWLLNHIAGDYGTTFRQIGPAAKNAEVLETVHRLLFVGQLHWVVPLLPFCTGSN